MTQPPKMALTANMVSFFSFWVRKKKSYQNYFAYILFVYPYSFTKSEQFSSAALSSTGTYHSGACTGNEYHTCTPSLASAARRVILGRKKKKITTCVVWNVGHKGESVPVCTQGETLASVWELKCIVSTPGAHSWSTLFECFCPSDRHAGARLQWCGKINPKERKKKRWTSPIIILEISTACFVFVFFKWAEIAHLHFKFVFFFNFIKDMATTAEKPSQFSFFLCRRHGLRGFMFIVKEKGKVVQQRRCWFHNMIQKNKTKTN